MQKVKRTLEKAMTEAGHILKKAMARPKKISYKSPVSLVTETDKKAEKTIIEIIKRNFPDHSILAEESDPKEGSHCKWIIDPVDGTTNFAHGFPIACISIGYEEDGKMKLGGVYNPFIEEWFWAEHGKGASLNGKKIQVSKVPAIKSSLLVTGFPYDRREKSDYYLNIFKNFLGNCHDVRRLGSAAIDLCYVACGRFDGYWEFGLKAWDQSAGAIIVEEAGGRLSDFRGQSFSVYGSQTLATNGKIHDEMLRNLKKLL